MKKIEKNIYQNIHIMNFSQYWLFFRMNKNYLWNWKIKVLIEMLLSTTFLLFLLIIYCKHSVSPLCCHYQGAILIAIVFAKLTFLLCIKSSVLGIFLSNHVVFQVSMVKAEVGFTDSCCHGYEWHWIGLKVCDDKITKRNYIVSETKLSFFKKKIVSERFDIDFHRAFLLSLFFYEERCLVV